MIWHKSAQTHTCDNRNLWKSVTMPIIAEILIVSAGSLLEIVKRIQSGKYKLN